MQEGREAKSQVSKCGSRAPWDLTRGRGAGGREAACADPRGLAVLSQILSSNSLDLTRTASSELSHMCNACTESMRTYIFYP